MQLVHTCVMYKLCYAVTRITEAVIEALEPTLNGIKREIQSMKENVFFICKKVDNITDELNQMKNKTASELADMHSSLQFMMTNLQTEVVGTVVSSNMDPFVDRLQARIDTVETRLNSKLASLENKVNSMTNRDITSLSTKLNLLQEHMTEDFGEVKRELSDVSNKTQEICDTVDDHGTEITAKLIEIKESMVEPYEGYTCGGTGGWRRAVYLDMTDPNTHCPAGWSMTGYSKRSCGRASTGWQARDSAFFPVTGGPYNQVCGRIKAYQGGSPDGFYAFSHGGQHTVDTGFLDGIAIMHGSPRQHVWSFVAGGVRDCPCDSNPPSPVPPFVGSDFFCESGYVPMGYWNRTVENSFHSSNALWDGVGCPNTSTCCSLHNPPYFTKVLSQKTTYDLELRMCLYTPLSRRNADIAVELVELYVKQDDVLDKLGEIEAQLKESFSHQTNNFDDLHIHTCGGTEGWRRAVYLDMTDPNMDCPSGWNITGHSKRSCGRATSGYYTCDSTFFPVSGGQYNEVCGRIKAYQASSPIAFAAYGRGRTSINSAYFSGVALMHGNPREHIWTFAAGSSENRITKSACPCDLSDNVTVPDFVGDDYFCESGYISRVSSEVWSDFHADDILWDGRDCHHTSTCCSHHSPPYFTKTLRQATAEDLELRMCHTNHIEYENIAVEVIELYVK